MDEKILTGSSVDKILEEFCKKNKVNKDDIQYEVIEEAKSGFLGIFGSKKAQIKITSFGIKQEIMDFIENFLEKMGLEFVDIEEHETKDSFNYHIVGSSEPGFLIGKEARFLNTMQYLVNRIFESRPEAKRIYLDVDNYKERQAEQIIKKYEPVLDRVVDNQKPYTLEPMDGNIRRVIHKYIEDRPEISTLTIGDGKYKRIVVFPKDYDQTKIRRRAYNPTSRRPQNHNKPRNPNSNTDNTNNTNKTSHNHKQNNNKAHSQDVAGKKPFRPRKKTYRKPKKHVENNAD